MLALSPSLFSTTYGWPMEDLIPTHLGHDCNEANSYSPLVDFHTFDQHKQSSPEYSNSSDGAAANGGGGDNTKVERKLNHNASERDRRKRVNELYAFLRSLLPASGDKKKKVSIPGTISRALKYIPELQNEVEILKRNKEKLTSYSMATGNKRQDHLGIKKQSVENSVIETKTPGVSNVNMLGDKEIVVQLISLAGHTSKSKDVTVLSKVLEYLEEEEDGLVLKNAMTFQCLGEGMLLSTLHFQLQGDNKVEMEKLKEKLNTFNQ